MCYVITFYAAILFLRGFCILICTYLVTVQGLAGLKKTDGVNW